MPEQPQSGQPAPSEVHASLHQLAQLLREARHLGPEAQQELARLVDELGAALEPSAASSGEMGHLADSVTHLTRALRQPRNKGLLAAAKARLEDAAVRIEEEAPLAVGIIQRLTDTLANLGI